MSFHCVVVTPEQNALDATVSQAIVPAHDGLIGILTGRAPILMKIGAGPLRVDLSTGEKKFYFIDGGVAQMKNNELTILTQEAIPANEINYEAAKAAYAKAAGEHPTDPAGQKEREHQMERARAQQQMSKK